MDIKSFPVQIGHSRQSARSPHAKNPLPHSLMTKLTLEQDLLQFGKRKYENIRSFLETLSLYEMHNLTSSHFVEFCQEIHSIAFYINLLGKDESLGNISKPYVIEYARLVRRIVPLLITLFREFDEKMHSGVFSHNDFNGFTLENLDFYDEFIRDLASYFESQPEKDTGDLEVVETEL